MNKETNSLKGWVTLSSKVEQFNRSEPLIQLTEQEAVKLLDSNNFMVYRGRKLVLDTIRFDRIIDSGLNTRAEKLKNNLGQNYRNRIISNAMLVVLQALTKKKIYSKKKNSSSKDDEVKTFNLTLDFVNTCLKKKRLDECSAQDLSDFFAKAEKNIRVENVLPTKIKIL